MSEVDRKRAKTLPAGKKNEVEIVYDLCSVEVPKDVTKLVCLLSVTAITERAFEGCTKLEEVVLNVGLETIGPKAFLRCESLRSIIIPSTVTEVCFCAFQNCRNLKEVVLNEGLQIIGKGAFYECTALTSIFIPSSVTKIASVAFSGCCNLKDVVLNEGLEVIEIGAFRDCKSLESIKLPSTVEGVEHFAFCQCTNLTEIMLCEGLRFIGYSAFDGCISLSSIALPSTVTEVGYQAFQDCNNLTEIILHEGLEKIEEEAFDGCSSLVYVKFPSISKRLKNLLQAGYSEIQDTIDNIQHFELNGDDLVVSTESMSEGYWCADWAVTKGHLDHVLSWVSYYELKEATTTIELAMWKAKIEETGAITHDRRNACRVDVPGPAKDAILQYLNSGSP